MISPPSVAIVILNWNGKHYLQQFLPFVVGTEYPHLQIIVADNASTDDSVSYLNKEWPQIKIIQLPKNFGFAQGYNEALKQVDAHYFVLLNSDVEVTKGWLQPIINLLEADASAAACQPKILSFKNKHEFEYAGAAGGWLDAYGYPFARGRVFDICEKDAGQYNNTTEVFWASGAALVIKKEDYFLVNGFDNYFFAHQEEIDMCWRLQLKGRKIFCCPQSVVYHVGGGTLPRGNSKKTYLNFRNNAIMLSKNLPWKEKWWKVPFRLLLDTLSAVKGVFAGDSGYFWAIFRAHWAYLYWVLLYGWRSKNGGHNIATKSLKGLYNGNIVWQHFVKGKTSFTQIINREK